MPTPLRLLPPALPEFLTEQLREQGFARGDAARCAMLLSDQPDRAEAAEIFVNLGSCKFLEGDVDGAIASWRHALSSDREAAGARALLNLGLLFEHLQLHGQALGVLASVADREHHAFDREALLAVARCHRALGQSELAMETMARLAQSTMQESPDSEELTEALYTFGEIAATTDRPDRAERAWRAASAAAPSPNQRAATDGLIGLLLAQGHDDELVELLENHTVGDSTHVLALLDRAVSLHQLGDVDHAVTLVESVTNEGLNIATRFRLADVRLQVGLVNEAIDELEVLLAEPSSEVQMRSSFMLGEVYRTYEMADPAQAMYERVIDQGDTYWSPKAALSMGDLAFAGGRRSEAATYWDLAASCPIVALRKRADSRFELLLEPELVAEVEEVEEVEVAVVEPEAALTMDDGSLLANPVNAGSFTIDASPVVVSLEGDGSQDSGSVVGAGDERLVHTGDEPVVVSLESDGSQDSGPVVGAGDERLVHTGDEPVVVSLEGDGSQDSGSVVGAGDERLVHTGDEPVVVSLEGDAAQDSGPVSPFPLPDRAPGDGTPLGRTTTADQSQPDSVVTEIIEDPADLAEPDASADAVVLSLDDLVPEQPQLPRGAFAAMALAPLDPPSLNEPEPETIKPELKSSDEEPVVVRLDDISAEPAEYDSGEPGGADVEPTVEQQTGQPPTPEPQLTEPTIVSLDDHEAAGDDYPSLMLVSDQEIADEYGSDEIALGDEMLDASSVSFPSFSAATGLRPDLTVVRDDETVDLAKLSRATVPADEAVVIDLHPADDEQPAAPSAFARLLNEPEPATMVTNPYASLAPEEGTAEDHNTMSTHRNPYAELAPNFDEDQYAPSPDVEPGDWESMLQDWPAKDGQPTDKASQAFSRYT